MRFYMSPDSRQKLVTAEEIATACCVSKDKVHNWTAAGLLKGVAPSGTLFEAASVVQFLVTSRLPVPHSLLPPKTKRVLFTCAESESNDSILDLIHTICSELAAKRNILLESCTTDSRMNLFILQEQPDLIIRYLSPSSCRLEQLQFPEGRPQPRMVQITAGEPGRTLQEGDTAPHADLVLSSSCSLAEAIRQINALFEL